MRRTELMTAAGATLAGLGVLVGVAIGSAGNGPKTVARRLPPVEVRTEIIRKTVNVYRKAKPHHVAAAGAGTGSAAAVAPGAPVPAATRSSGAPAAAAAPVAATRSSGGGSGSGSSRVSTRSSGGGEHEGGGHDD